jgi:hypothetical protein
MADNYITYLQASEHCGYTLIERGMQKSMH